MKIYDLNKHEQKIIFDCLKAALHGPFFPDWEFQTLFGVERGILARIVAAWPNVEFNDPDVRLSVHNAMGQLIGYPHGEEKAFKEYIAVSPQVVEDLFYQMKKKSII
jgi:hypothetical protein